MGKTSTHKTNAKLWKFHWKYYGTKQKNENRKDHFHSTTNSVLKFIWIWKKRNNLDLVQKVEKRHALFPLQTHFNVL